MKTKLFIALALLSFSVLFAQIGVPYIEQAQNFLDRGFCSQAEALMEKAIAQSPNNYENYLVMFKVKMAKGDMQSAYDNLEVYVNNASGIDFDYYDNLLKLIEDSVIRISKGLRQYQIGYFPEYLNSEYSDFAPIVSPDGNYLYFTSARKCQALKENIFVSEKIGGTWGKPQPVKTLLTNNNESLNSFSTDSKYAYLFGNYEGRGKSGIYRTDLVQTAFTTPEKIEAVSSNYSELQPYVFEDRVMFFTSNRPGSIGGYDLWVSENINGWQEPINLGSVINTINDEQTPFVSWDGQTLFFASNGHSSFGGFDIFRAKKSGSSWTDWEAPINLGPEINTIYNERHYYRVEDSNVAYISSDRANGKGGEDNYKVVILNEEYLDGIRIYGEVKDDKGQPVSADINWSFTYKDKDMVNVIQSNADGFYNLYLPRIDSVYITITKPNYQSYDNSILFENSIDELNYDIEILLLEETNYVINNIYFDFDKAVLKEESFPSLDKLVNTIMTNKDIEVCIIGYTDDVGSAAYNQKLSERRAKAVYQYLIDNGIDKEILNYRGEGQDNPIAPNDTDENRQLNRRVEFNVSRNNQLLYAPAKTSPEMPAVKEVEEVKEIKQVKEVESKELPAAPVLETEVDAELPKAEASPVEEKASAQVVQLEELTAKAEAKNAKLEKLIEESNNIDAPTEVEVKPLDTSAYMSDVEVAMVNNVSKNSGKPFFTESDSNIIKSRILRIAEEYQIQKEMQIVLENKENKINVSHINFATELKNDSFDQEIKNLLNGWFIPGVTAKNYILVVDPLEAK